MVTAVSESGLTDSIKVTVKAPESIVVNAENELTLSYGHTHVLYKFVPAVSDTYTFSSNGETDPYMYLYDEDFNTIIYVDDNGNTPDNDVDFIYSTRLVAGETYYIMVSDYTYDMDDCSFVFKLAGPTTGTTIVKQPESVVALKGATAVFETEVVGDGLTYQWQCLTSVDGTWTDIAGETSASLSVVTTLAHNGYQYRCVVTDADEATVTTDAATLTVNNVSVSATLALEKEVHIVLRATVAGFDELDLTENMGLLVWSGDDEVTEADATVDSKTAEVIDEVTFDGSRYTVITSGIAAKRLGDDVQFRLYVDLGNGEYAYSKLYSYSPVTYASKIFTQYDADSTMYKLCVDMLNYGAAAQNYFGYKTDALANDVLSDAEKALDWDSSLVSSLSQITVTGLERDSAVFTSRTATLALEGALDFQFMFKINADTMSTAKDSGIMRWSQETYDAAGGALTMDNADAVDSLSLMDDGRYLGVYPGVAAKDYDDLVYVCAYVVDADGNYHYSGVLRYSVEAYAASALKNSDNAALTNAVKWLITYCEAAKQHFE